MPEMTNFDEFKLGNVVRVTMNGKPMLVTANNRSFSDGKVIAVNPADKSVAFADPQTDERGGVFIIPTAIKLYKFELVSSGSMDDSQVIDMQAKAAVWLSRFVTFKKNVESIEPPLTDNGRAIMKQASKDISSLVLDYDFITFSMTDEDSTALNKSLNDTAKLLGDITTSDSYDADAKAKLMNLLYYITEALRAPGKFLIHLPANVYNEISANWPPWTKYAVGGGIVIVVGLIVLKKTGLL